ncbi:hypothetical protein E1A91_D08G055200v1 [Gossypium mustelinum]|uniref:UBC core domain-containing protein n=1 Tax=Gossypium mustelinum TaxID=34275 RepID=A0A5D2TUB0_GOSMU|nr:hypothetical protein E1A91_D08G055200v1 [Gossypium mustelinum]
MASTRNFKNRILKELEDIQNDPPEFFSLAPENEDKSIWQATMPGPLSSPYEGGTFELSIHLPPDYPLKPPKVAFRTKIYHPNIDSDGGSIGIDILKDKNWLPGRTIKEVLLAIYLILGDPQLDNPLEENTANMVKTVARKWTQMYAMGPAYKRISEELKSLEKSNPSYANAAILDLRGTPYNGGMFQVDIHFSRQYPNEPPKVVFRTKIFHPNIDENGSIGLDILKDRWSKDLSISQVLHSIRSLLKNPNPDAPLVPWIAHMCKTNCSEYDTTARSWTLKYAMG